MGNMLAKLSCMFRLCGCLDSRNSLTGYEFTLFGSAITISWKVNLQHVVALPSIEAEYIVVIEAV